MKVLDNFETFCSETPLGFANGCYIQAITLFAIVGFFATFVWV